MIYIPAQFTDEEFSTASRNNLLPCKCQQCGKIFYKQKHFIQSYIKKLKINPTRRCGFYCCSKCSSESKITKQLVTCEQCGKEFYKVFGEIKTHNFCSQSCSAKFGNKNRKSGYRRSSIELYLESILQQKYPGITFIFNDRNVCNGYELDIYIPKLYLAIELNGIIHYKPIYGNKKLKYTQYKDYCKKLYCQMKNVKLIVIDISTIMNFTDEYKTKILNLVCSFIDNKK